MNKDDIDDCQITVTLRVYPYCNHREFDPTCLWCADAQRIYRELLDIPRKYSLQHTKVAVIEGINPARR